MSDQTDALDAAFAGVVADLFAAEATSGRRNTS